MAIIYKTPKKEVMENLLLAEVLLFDIDNTLIDFGKARNDPTIKVTWRVIEKTIGLDKNPKHQEVFRKYVELSKLNKGRDEKLAKELNNFYKGHSIDELRRDLYPIPYLSNVLHFFEELKKSRKNYFLGIISSAPTFYVEDIAKQLGMDSWEGCDVILDEKGICTGEMKSNGIYGKGKSIEDFCRKYRFAVERVAYHGDEVYDISALKLCGIGIAFDPKGGLEGDVAKASDVILYDWIEHPLLALLK